MRTIKTLTAYLGIIATLAGCTSSPRPVEVTLSLGVPSPGDPDFGRTWAMATHSHPDSRVKAEKRGETAPDETR